MNNLSQRQLNSFLIYKICEKTNEEIQFVETALKDKFELYYIADSYDKEDNKIDMENYIKVYTPLEKMSDDEVEKFNKNICDFINEKKYFNLDFLKNENNNQKNIIKNLI